MDITGIITAVGTSGAITGFFAWLGSRVLNRTVADINKSQAEMNSAQANVTRADYAEKMIELNQKRVQQYEQDAENWRKKLVETDNYAKEQRNEKRKFRSANALLKDQLHQSELRNKDLEHALAVADWEKCIDDTCKNRVPARNKEKPNSYATIQ
jgi:hypothetical protein